MKEQTVVKDSQLIRFSIAVYKSNFITLICPFFFSEECL